KGDKPPKATEDDFGLVISTRGGSRAHGATLADAQQAIARANNLKLAKMPPGVRARGGIVPGPTDASPEPYKSSDLPHPRYVGGISIRYYAKPEAGKDDGDKVLD